MRKFSAGAILLAFLGLIPLQSIAQSTGRIIGSVEFSDGKPAAFVVVNIQEINKSILTAENGTYKITGVAPGIYTLVCSSLGLKSEQKSIEVTTGNTTQADFVLSETASHLPEVIIIGAVSGNQKRVAIGKLDAVPMDLPQSIAVIDNDIIEEQQSQKLSDVVKNVNGVYLGTTRGSTQETFYARGYSFGSNNMFKNGARINTGAMPEVSSLDRVEVLKGSAAILFGSVAPGGILNLVTKKPQFENGGSLSLRTGSFDLYKPALDLYGPITKNIAYRFNGTYESANSYRNQVSSDRYYFNPSVLFKVDNRTEILIQGDHLKHNYTPDFGTGAINNRIADVARGSYLGTSWATGNTEQSTVSANLTRRISGSWNLDLSTAYQKYHRQFQTVERIQPLENGDWTRPLGKSNTSENYFTTQINLKGKVHTGSVSHSLLIGADADTYENKNFTYTETVKGNFQYLDEQNVRRSANYDVINILDPAKYTPRTDMPVMNPIKMAVTPTSRAGIYVSDLMEISSKLNILAGIRLSYQKSLRARTTDLVSRLVTLGASKGDRAFSPNVGVVYKPAHFTSIFASYANSFNVNSGTDVQGNSLKPSIIDQYEVGIKNELFKGMLSANISAYRIINHNLAQTAPFLADGITPNTNSALKELTGETTSEGIEVDLTGHPVMGLDLLAGYSHNFMRYTNTAEAIGNYVEGQRLVNSPAHTANASAFYTFTRSKVKGLKIGATANYVGNRLAGWNNTIGQSQTGSRLVPVSDFTTIDLSAGYNFRKMSLLIKVSNLSNTLNYYVHENYSVNPIPPRQFAATLSYKF